MAASGRYRMLSYLLADPARFLEGDILYIRADEHVTSAQLLTILLNTGEIIAEKPVIMQNSASSLAEDVSCFWQEQLIPYAAEYGLYKDGVWNLDQILLKAAEMNRSSKKHHRSGKDPGFSYSCY
jgi:hypothetical protein